MDQNCKSKIDIRKYDSKELLERVSAEDYLYDLRFEPDFISEVSSYYYDTLEQLFVLKEDIKKKEGCIKPENKISCTCGAKHTSNPTYHLKYCDVSTKE